MHVHSDKIAGQHVCLDCNCGQLWCLQLREDPSRPGPEGLSQGGIETHLAYAESCLVNGQLSRAAAHIQKLVQVRVQHHSCLTVLQSTKPSSQNSCPYMHAWLCTACMQHCCTIACNSQKVDQVLIVVYADSMICFSGMMMQDCTTIIHNIGNVNSGIHRMNSLLLSRAVLPSQSPAQTYCLS